MFISTSKSMAKNNVFFACKNLVIMMENAKRDKRTNRCCSDGNRIERQGNTVRGKDPFPLLLILSIFYFLSAYKKSEEQLSYGLLLLLL